MCVLLFNDFPLSFRSVSSLEFVLYEAHGNLIGSKLVIPVSGFSTPFLGSNALCVYCFIANYSCVIFSKGESYVFLDER